MPPETFNYLTLSPETTFSWFPLLVCVFIWKLFSSVFKRVVTAVKVIYFTLFYARILHPEELASDIRSELKNYLAFGTDSEAPQGVGAHA